MHGVERRRPDGSRVESEAAPADQAAAAAIDRLRPALKAMVRQYPGLWLEDKGRTLALHYRAAPETASEICDRAERLLREHGDGLRLIAGKMVVEFHA